MTWFKVDDSFWSHPKTLSLSAEAVALWVRAGSWSCQHLTDGLIAERAIPTLGGSSSAAVELVDAGFWDEVEDGYFFHDWDEYQESSETVKERRRKARERMQAVRAKRERTQHERAMEQNAKFEESSLNPDPTRPDPSSTKKKPASRGTRVPPNFVITDDMRHWASKETPLVDLDAKLGAWIDYWTAVPGEKGVKLDWVSTWRNGMRKQQEFAERDRGNVTPIAKKRFVAHAD